MFLFSCGPRKGRRCVYSSRVNLLAGFVIKFLVSATQQRGKQCEECFSLDFLFCWLAGCSAGSSRPFVDVPERHAGQALFSVETIFTTTQHKS